MERQRAEQEPAAEPLADGRFAEELNAAARDGPAVASSPAFRGARYQLGCYSI
jgi:hypothetical protein